MIFNGQRQRFSPSVKLGSISDRMWEVTECHWNGIVTYVMFPKTEMMKQIFANVYF